ncbi:MAG: ABC transporter ATP-binding protein, partial [Pseudomonadota bacterium]
SVEAGEMVALMGRNGMGKTTTIHSIFCLTPPARGSVRFEGREITGLPAHKVARQGLGLVPEGRRIFPNLTVEENLLATARPGEWTVERIFELFPQLDGRREQMGGTLSGGEQQMLAIGRALATNPRLLVLDEATEGLAPTIRRDIWHAIHVLKQQNLAILIVDKSLKELLAVADRCVVLEKGRTAWTGTASALSENRDLQNRYLGV